MLELARKVNNINGNKTRKHRPYKNCRVSPNSDTLKQRISL
jgi:hypothetical protein